MSGDHCLELVRAGDKDRFLAALFAPDDLRPHLLALYAFNLEVARIREVVSEPQIGLMRQQWWLDTLEGIYAGEAQAHPVAEALASAIAAGRLPQHALRGLVIAREFDLYSEPMQSLEQLEAYLGETASALVQLAALLLAGPGATGAAEAAGLAGVAFGLSQVLRDPERCTRYLPPGMDAAAARAHARQRLEEARALRHTIPDLALPAFLPVCLTPLYLTRPSPSQFRRQMTMWWSARRNMF